MLSRNGVANAYTFELYHLHDYGNHTIHATKLACQMRPFLHHYSMVGSILGLVQHNWLASR
jgi:hypothetical protein